MSLSTKITSWREYPICLLGYDIRRWETIHGLDSYHPEMVKKLLFFKSVKGEGPTHLQYQSRFGFLLAWPLCLHIWLQFKEQKTDEKGLRIPGSETALYWRFGARWEAETGFYVFPSWYGPGLHFD